MSSESPADDLDAEAFGTATLLSKRTCLDHAASLFAKDDPFKLKHFTAITTQLADTEVHCLYCNLKGPRFLLLNYHTEKCRQEYFRVFLKSTVDLTHDEPPHKIQCVVKNEMKDPSPIKSKIEQTIDATGQRVDVVRCMYFIEKHRSGQITNTQFGMTISTPIQNQLRICDFSHITNESERSVIFKFLAAAVESDGVFPDTNVCAKCCNTKQIPLLVTVGKRPGSSGVNGIPVRKLHFCTLLCFQDYVCPLTINKWNEMVKAWAAEVKKQKK